MRPERIRRIECHAEEDAVVDLSVGETVYYQFHRHCSVGEDAEFQIENPQIVRHERTELEYVNPERMRPGWTGGDAQNGRWFFKVLEEGTTRLTIRTLFRGRIDNECTIRLIVKTQI